MFYDDITGYTMQSIESVFLKNVYELSGLEQELKANKPSEVTDAQIETYFAYPF